MGFFRYPSKEYISWYIYAWKLYFAYVFWPSKWFFVSLILWIWYQLATPELRITCSHSTMAFAFAKGRSQLHTSCYGFSFLKWLDQSRVFLWLTRHNSKTNTVVVAVLAKIHSKILSCVSFMPFKCFEFLLGIDMDVLPNLFMPHSNIIPSSHQQILKGKKP